MLKTSFIVVIPAYNEEKHLNSLLTNILKYTSNIIVINDGSNDESAKICRKFSIKTINMKSNQGKGNCLKLGMRLAYKNYPKLKWIVTMDADGQHLPEDIPKLIEKITKEKSVIVIGNRISSKQLTLNFPFRRYLVNVITTKFINRIFNLGLTDLQSGFRIYHHKIIPFLLDGTYSSKFQFETEILLEAWALNLKISEVNVKKFYHPSLPSRIKGFEDSLRWIWIVFLRMLIFPKKLSQRRKFQSVLKKIS